MRVVLQRVSRAQVAVDGAVVGRIGRGLVLLAGFKEGDGQDDLSWMADKIIGLRVFPDEEDRMNLSLSDVEGDLLVVSQFTLYGDVHKGRRPSFVHAAPPDVATPLYEAFVEALRTRAPARVETGRFGALMEVGLVNDGPVTLVIDRP
jgi:D-tyrosyl-tRNA(Tyr) deacylase